MTAIVDAAVPQAERRCAAAPGAADEHPRPELRASDLAHANGVAGSWRVPTTRIGGAVGRRHRRGRRRPSPATARTRSSCSRSTGPSRGAACAAAASIARTRRPPCPPGGPSAQPIARNDSSMPAVGAVGSSARCIRRPDRPRPGRRRGRRRRALQPRYVVAAAPSYRRGRQAEVELGRRRACVPAACLGRGCLRRRPARAAASNALAALPSRWNAQSSRRGCTTSGSRRARASNPAACSTCMLLSESSDGSTAPSSTRARTLSGTPRRTSRRCTCRTRSRGT